MPSIATTDSSGSESPSSRQPADFDFQAVRQAAAEAFRQARPEIDALIAAMPSDRPRLMATIAACWLEIRRWSVRCRAFGLRRRFIVANGPASGMCELAGPGCRECPFPSAAAQARVQLRPSAAQPDPDVQR
ncbi:MAG TPA: hypothetical protein VG204_03740 [Terriglobia bacterium]|nr:hypothetical protein [Terriglobia bacterium]